MYAWIKDGALTCMFEALSLSILIANDSAGDLLEMTPQDKLIQTIQKLLMSILSVKLLNAGENPVGHAFQILMSRVTVIVIMTVNKFKPLQC